LLPKLYYCHGGSIKKTQSKRPTKTTQSKWSNPNQLVQNGTLIKLDMGAKNHAGIFSLPKFPIKKVDTSYSGPLCNVFSPHYI